MKITKAQLRRIIAEGQDQFSHVVKSSTGIFGRPMEIDEEMDGNLVIVADEAEVEKHYSELMSVFPRGEMIEDGFATGVYEDMSRAPFRESKMKITKRQLRRIIKEEKAKLLEENEYFQGSMMDLDDHNRMVAQIDRIIINFTKNGRFYVITHL